MTARLLPALVYLVYPGVIAGSLAMAVSMLEAGASGGATVAATSLLFAAICAALEWVAPDTSRWRLEAGEARTDLLHALLSNPLPTALYRVLFFGAIASLSEAVSTRIGFGPWPTAWPLVAQVALALAVAEAASYAIHRFLHKSRLWPLHAVHHCSPRMYFLLATRKHPIQAFISYGGRLSVLWLLGVPADVLSALIAVTAAHSFVQHANVRMHTGPLGWIFATPELHRLHHSSRTGELDSNYGDVLIVWDVLFGTRRDPAHFHREVGLPGLRVPQTYASHLRLPFVWSKLQRGSR